MSSIGPKPARLRLDPNSHKQLYKRVLRRDGWRCQACGPMSNLGVHYKQLRSQPGSDEDSNLITLCAGCMHNYMAFVVKIIGHGNDRKVLGNRQQASRSLS